MPAMAEINEETSPRLRRKVIAGRGQGVGLQRLQEATKTERSSASSWGRSSSSAFGINIGSAIIISLFPFLVAFFWMAANRFNGSMLNLMTSLVEKPRGFMDYFPKPTIAGFALYFGWVIFQAALYSVLPGKLCHGQETPAGHLLAYRVNGLEAWGFTHLLFLYLTLYRGLFPASIIHDHWGSLFIAANFYGYFMAGFAYIKAHLFPSHPADRKFSGSVVYDFFMGIEFNPRFGEMWDFKLFHNGRPGIVAWSLINASFMAAQYQTLGFVTNSMVLVNLLQGLYILDFFTHEDWYLRTIDIAHDHFGFYLSWGDSVWLPFMYTLQAQYLATHPTRLTKIQLYAVLAIGLLGYVIFRCANNQKDRVRKTNGACKIWGKPATFIKATYKTSDGKEHQSLLLTSGCWGLSRHFNYFGDLLLSLAMCMACGFNHVLPYFYFVYMVILLLTRVNRDQARCHGKYGKSWDEYCQKVPYKIIPYVY